MNEAATVIQANFRGYLARKRNRDIDLIFGALVAEVEPDKLLNFWDFEAISRRSTKNRSSSSKHEASQKSKSTDCQSILTELNSLDFQEAPVATSTGKLNIDTSPTQILTDAGFNPRSLSRPELDNKRAELLSELWWLQSAILSRREMLSKSQNHSG